LNCPIPCNLCGSSDIDELSARDRHGRPLRTTICRVCGLVWSNPRPSEEEIRRYYSREYRLDYKGRATPHLRHVARSGRGALNRSRELTPLLRASDRILDAGAGGGEVVYVLRKLGYDAQGLEPDEAYAQHARDVLGVPVQTGFVQDASFPRGTFNAVTMYHALEHVEDPVAVVAKLRCWIAADGILLIEVPNVEARCIEPRHRFHFAHFYNFNRMTLEWTGRRAGFVPIRTSTSPDGGNLITIFRASPVAEDRTAIPAGNYDRVARAVRSHSAAGYYLSAAPYAGPVGRLRGYLKDRWAVRGKTSAREVLDGLLTH